MTNDKYNTTTLTASAYNRKVSVELPVDCSANELLDAFRAIMNDAILNYVDEHELLKDRNLQSDNLYNAETNINLDTIRRYENCPQTTHKPRLISATFAAIAAAEREVDNDKHR